ncbi:hypothetical protein Syun_021270 [Stephania yunnanensis]|uniref:Uncharacterized protein n=1 Tax=Stephania yunnanensis TaxID=152371 RepID=A0AAP0NPM1_9MAGN
MHEIEIRKKTFSMLGSRSKLANSNYYVENLKSHKPRCENEYHPTIKLGRLLNVQIGI